MAQEGFDGGITLGWCSSSVRRLADHGCSSVIFF
jgi:hypothetical protein